MTFEQYLAGEHAAGRGMLVVRIRQAGDAIAMEVKPVDVFGRVQTIKVQGNNVEVEPPR